jgi:hypothetical protein
MGAPRRRALLEAAASRQASDVAKGASHSFFRKMRIIEKNQHNLLISNYSAFVMQLSESSRHKGG